MECFYCGLVLFSYEELYEVVMGGGRNFRLFGGFYIEVVRERVCLRFYYEIFIFSGNLVNYIVKFGLKEFIMFINKNLVFIFRRIVTCKRNINKLLSGL